MSNCLNCNKETTNPKFCSRSCAATYNNKHRGKQENYCVDCGCKIKLSSTRCIPCNKLYKRRNKITLSDLTRNDAGRYSVVRIRAVTDYTNSNKKQICANCGYDKHVHICHIKPISDFPQDALIDDINNLDNLVALCPNCHWEFDSGLLWLFLPN